MSFTFEMPELAERDTIELSIGTFQLRPLPAMKVGLISKLGKFIQGHSDSTADDVQIVVSLVTQVIRSTEGEQLENPTVFATALTGADLVDLFTVVTEEVEKNSGKKLKGRQAVT